MALALYQNQSRNRWEASAKFQNIVGNSTFKYGFEFYRNAYDINQLSTGPSNVFANPLGVAPSNGSNPANISVSGFRMTNNFVVCTTRTIGGVGTVVCPSISAVNAFQRSSGRRTARLALPLMPFVPLPRSYLRQLRFSDLTAAEALNNPFLMRASTRVRDFKLTAQTETDVESLYFQDDWRVMKNLQFNIGARWDYQQARGNGGVTYLKLNNWFDNLQPRLGFTWDPWSTGKTKVFANYARYVETPIPLDINVRAGSNDTQTDKNFNVNTLNAPTQRQRSRPVLLPATWVQNRPRSTRASNRRQ